MLSEAAANQPLHLTAAALRLTAFRDSMSHQPPRQVNGVVRSFPIRQPADKMLQARFPHADAGDKKFNSRLVTPIFAAGKNGAVEK